jgi:Hypothetical glycosyl hydrolase 6
VGEAEPRDLSRRRFLQQLAGGAALLAVGAGRGFAADAPVAPATASRTPWFRRSFRWGQTNLTEIDPVRFDLAWWRDYWKRTALQGVVANAGGIVAYYPTEVPFHRRAQYLGGRDLFGEITRAAHEDGLAVFARMDSNRAGEDFYRAHPDWFAHDVDGKPYRSTELYQACVNGPYYEEHIPAILREVATHYRPDGFTDNNWNGPMRHQPCFCANCERKFHARTGRSLPRRADWNDSLYREWIMWNYECRLEVWDRFNAVTRAAAGPDCAWVGMMAGSQSWQARVFRDDREIFRRADIVMLDDQRRHDNEGFQHNSEVGLRIRSAGGWDKIVPESMAMYNAGEDNFRLAAKPVPEARMWVLEGFAGGIQPWWHLIGAAQEDRRVFETAPPLWRWHRDHEEFLVNRRPVATVGLLWSQRNMDFFGRDEGGVMVDEPWNGFTQALVRGRIPYVPVHLDDLEREAAALGLKTVILPNLAALSDAQVASLRRFVAAGGGLVATGMSSLCNEWGDVRPDFALANLFGAHLPAGHGWRDEVKRTAFAKDWSQTYLRLPPESVGTRHEVLQDFAGTDIVGFGGGLEALEIDAGAIVPLTFVPAVPVMPVEGVWMRETQTNIPGLVLSERSGNGRVAYLPADLDRRFARDNVPDHGNLLARLVRWSAGDDLPLRVRGAGLVDCHLYRQTRRLVLHVVNLTSAGTWRAPVQELIPVGPTEITVRLPTGVDATAVRALVTNQKLAATRDGESVQFAIPVITDHEVLVIG